MNEEKNTTTKKRLRLRLSYSAVFFGVWLLAGLFTVLKTHRSYSRLENRQLARLEAPTLSAVADGSFAAAVSSWFADQFPCRDACITVNSAMKRLLGEREIKGVYMGGEKQLFLIPDTPDEAAMEKNLAAIDAFSKRNEAIDSYLCLVPNAIFVQKDKLPSNAPAPDQRAQIGKAYGMLEHTATIDVFPALSEKKDDYIYYRSDHHWTGLGAQTAFYPIAGAMGIDAPITDYEVCPVTDEFSGTLSKKAGRCDVRDRIDIYLPETDEVYNVEYVGEEKKTGSMYEKEALSSADPYTVFFGGNHGRVDIRTTVQNGRKLLVFKDSYFNTLAQFMWPYFEKVVIVDPRYYYAYAGSIVRQEGITDILYIYNADTFGTDQNLYAVLEEQ